MESDKSTNGAVKKSGNKNNALTWSLGGMVGGLVVGITLASIYGWTFLSASFWLGFGLLVGALSGAISYLLYRAISGLVA